VENRRQGREDACIFMAQIDLKGWILLIHHQKYFLFKWPPEERAVSLLELFHGDGPS
jgi:hypothetical protein